jgi:hypothetical protein
MSELTRVAVSFQFLGDGDRSALSICQIAFARGLSVKPLVVVDCFMLAFA